MTTQNKKQEPVRQHYVPQCYLVGFKDPLNRQREPVIWIFDKDGKNRREAKVKNVLIKKHIYTIVLSGTRDYSVETTLARLEGQYIKIFRNKIAKHLPLSEDEHVVFSIFVAAMIQRTLRQKNNFEMFLKEVVTRGEMLLQQHGRKSSKSLDEWKKFRENGYKLNLIEALPDIAQLIFEMNLAFLFSSKQKSKFITSDDPCNLFNPKLQWQQFQGPGLGQKHAELVMPLSTNITACFSWSNLRGYLEIKPGQVEEINRMVRGHAYQYFITSSPKTKRRWFLSFPLDLIFILKIIKHKIKLLIRAVRSKRKKMEI